MRIFENFDEMYSEVRRDLKELGTWRKSHSVQNIRFEEHNPDYDMMELVGYAFKLNDLGRKSDPISDNTELGYILAEISDRFSHKPLNPGTSWQWRSRVWEPLMRDGRFDYTYSERLWVQIPKVIAEINRRPGTRQAILTMFREEDLNYLGGERRVPCSLTYQFLKRDDKIHVIYNMRSCDYFTHFKFDVILTWLMMGRIADNTNSKQGSLTMMIGSFHAFRKDLEGVF